MSSEHTEREHAEWGSYTAQETVEMLRDTVTYRARRSDARACDHPQVLIKTLRSGATATRDQLRMLEREADAMVMVNHPMLPTLIETLGEGARFALVLDDLGGHRLDVVLERTRQLPVAVAVTIALEVSRALAVIHRAGRAHGRLSPAAIELSAHGMVRLHGAFAFHPQLAGDLAPPQHMAPEQIVGDAPAARSDVFSLGVVLYQMLAGVEPFGAAEGGISQRIRHQPAASLARHNSDVSAALQQVVSRCLAKRPADRFADMTSLSCHLLRLLRLETSLPSEHLVVRALADASLGEEFDPPAEQRALGGRMLHPRQWSMRLAVAVAVTVACITTGLFLWGAWGQAPSNPAATPQGVLRRPAQLRVLAHPWAAIHIDGKLVESESGKASIRVCSCDYRIHWKPGGDYRIP